MGGGRMVEDETVGVVLDTAAGCWCPLESQPPTSDDWMRRSHLFWTPFVSLWPLPTPRHQCHGGLHTGSC